MIDGVIYIVRPVKKMISVHGYLKMSFQIPFPPICVSYWFERLCLVSEGHGRVTRGRKKTKSHEGFRLFTVALLGIPFTSCSPWVLRTEPRIRNEVLNDLGRDFHSIRASLDS